ncbi:MAG: 3-oxoacyl-(acyl-carrier-protein) synthase III [Chlorobi bacterium OLB5]|nr:MAG: 3-oxoacyl-(acyl-carrier-protein) synthase III [Chlorobi bacterium OLB5]
MNKTRAAITAVGHYVPDNIMTNADLAKIVETNDEWIKTRTGISERRILNNGEPSSFMAVEAIKMLLERRGITADELDMILVGTVTPDMLFPSTACIIQEKIGASKAWGFDVLAACSGFIFTLITGAQYIESGMCKKVLVVGSDKMSTITNFKDRNTCVLFGDGAGCVLLEPSEDPDYGIMDSILRVDGKGGKYLYMKGGGSLNPPSHETVENDWHYVFQDGKFVFKDAVKGMADVSVELMEKNNLSSDDISYLVPHQANMRILTACADRMGLPQDKVMVNIHKYGNTTAATIPLCLSEYWAEGKIKKGDNLVLSSFGAGYTWGAIWVKWAY